MEYGAIGRRTPLEVISMINILVVEDEKPNQNESDKGRLFLYLYL